MALKNGKRERRRAPKAELVCALRGEWAREARAEGDRGRRVRRPRESRQETKG
jgi:hypothetical protein